MLAYVYEGDKKFSLRQMPKLSAKRELPVFGVHASTPAQNKNVLDMIANGQINVKKYISKTYPLRKINDAFEEIKNKNIMKAVVKP